MHRVVNWMFFSKKKVHVFASLVLLQPKSLKM